MGTIHGEIEFEFRGDEEGGGEFLSCGKVLQSLMMFLSQDQIDEAAKLDEGALVQGALPKKS